MVLDTLALFLTAKYITYHKRNKANTARLAPNYSAMQVRLVLVMSWGLRNLHWMQPAPGTPRRSQGSSPAVWARRSSCVFFGPQESQQRPARQPAHQMSRPACSPAASVFLVMGCRSEPRARRCRWGSGCRILVRTGNSRLNTLTSYHRAHPSCRQLQVCWGALRGEPSASGFPGRR